MQLSNSLGFSGQRSQGQQARITIITKNNRTVTGLWAGLSKGGCYLPGIHLTGGTSSFVYI